MCRLFPSRNEVQLNEATLSEQENDERNASPLLSKRSFDRRPLAADEFSISRVGDRSKRGRDDPTSGDEGAEETDRCQNAPAVTDVTFRLVSRFVSRRDATRRVRIFNFSLSAEGRRNRAEKETYTVGNGWLL